MADVGFYVLILIQGQNKRNIIVNLVRCKRTLKDNKSLYLIRQCWSHMFIILVILVSSCSQTSCSVTLGLARGCRSDTSSVSWHRLLKPQRRRPTARVASLIQIPHTFAAAVNLSFFTTQHDNKPLLVWTRHAEPWKCCLLRRYKTQIFDQANSLRGQILQKVGWNWEWSFLVVVPFPPFWSV